MAAARAGPERFGIALEPEVQTLGPVPIPRRLAARMMSRAPAAGQSRRPGSPTSLRQRSPTTAFERGRTRRRPRLGPLLLVTALLVAGLLVGGYFWVRSSSLSAVRSVKVTGLGGAEAGQIRDALETTARSMSTLNVNTGACSTTRPLRIRRSSR